MPKKRKILFSSNHHKAYTGFGKNLKNALSYLYKTGKYEIIEFANGVSENHPELQYSPWKCIGSIPNDAELHANIRKDPNLGRVAGYGHFSIDSIIQQEKPDIYIGIEDVWAFSEFEKRKWWNKINVMVWTTLDSLPILPQANELAKNTKNFYVWASFAEKAMKQNGLNNVKTLHGSIDASNFQKLEEENIKNLKKTFNITDDFIIGFVFRNQLRKTVPKLLDGFKLFSEKYPESRAKLLLHTSFKEGWNIPQLCQDKGIDPSKVLTTYVCSNCKNYTLHPFVGHDLNCPFCKSEKTFNTTSIENGVNEAQLNEIYNVMDVYCHPFTSGGQEIPIQEAKLCELITLVTNYSCGEDMCTEESGGLPLDWDSYYEPNTHFIKATTKEVSICDQLEKVYKMSEKERENIGQKARQYVIDNYSSDSIGKRLEEIIDSMPDVDWDYDFSVQKCNEDYVPDFNIESDDDFVLDLYKNVLKFEPAQKDFEHWLQQLKSGVSRNDVAEYFKSVAKSTNSQNQKAPLEDFIDDDKKYKIGIKIPTDTFISLCCTYFFESLYNLYDKDCAIYVFANPLIHDVIEGNDYVYKVLDIPKNFNPTSMEGAGDMEGYFDVFYNVPDSEVVVQNYSHNCLDRGELCI